MWADNPYDRFSPISDALGKVSNAYIASGASRVYGFTVFSSNASSQFVLMFDASSLPADNAVPLMAFPISASANVGLYYGAMGRVFNRGFILCTSSTATTKTLNATADCLFDVQYDQLGGVPLNPDAQGGQ